ncbi:MAG: hypothetical protein K9H84_08625 [Bacteroidales bacterium]|nr:hypothetical protein [Bacteroidales bacterium]
MGCPRLTYHQNPSPLKVVYSAKSRHQKIGANVLYFGARYYDSEVSVWLSVDPMASGFPGVSAYAYCYNNPMNYIDAWGLAPEGDEDKKKNKNRQRSGYGNVRDLSRTYTGYQNIENYNATKTESDRGGGFFRRLFEKNKPKGIIPKTRFVFADKKGFPGYKYKKSDTYQITLSEKDKRVITNSELNDHFGYGHKITQINIKAVRENILTGPVFINAKNKSGNLLAFTGLFGLPGFIKHTIDEGFGPFFSGNSKFYPLSWFILKKTTAIVISRNNYGSGSGGKYRITVHAKVPEEVSPQARSKLWQLLWLGRILD